MYSTSCYKERLNFEYTLYYIGCSFKVIFKVVSIVNTPRITDHGAAD
jgi:hypothetical protein